MKQFTQIFVGAFVCSISLLSEAQEPGPSKPPTNSAGPQFPQFSKHLVIIESSAGKGSGSIIQVKGNSLIVTNAHVVSGAADVTFRLLDATALKWSTLGVARGADVAVLTQSSLQGGLELMQEVERNVNIGDAVVVLGNSEGAGVITEIPGKVSGIGPELIEVDAKFVAGNSGSPIIHVKSGKVIAIATFATIRKLDVLTKDSKFTEIRRFGYRLDNVAKWEFPKWDVFQKEAKIIAGIDRQTEFAIPLLIDIYDDGLISSARHQQSDNRFKPAVTAFVEELNIAQTPIAEEDVAAEFSPEALPGEDADEFLARRKKLADLGALGPRNLPRNEAERQSGALAAEAARKRLVKAALAKADADQPKRIAEAQKEAKEKFLRRIATETTADTTPIKPETFTDYHAQKLRAEIKFRKALREEFEKLSTTQEAGKKFTLP